MKAPAGASQQVTSWVAWAAHWIKWIGTLALLLVCVAMTIAMAAKVIGFHFPFPTPPLTQDTALIIAALAYSLTKT